LTRPHLQDRTRAAPTAAPDPAPPAPHDCARHTPDAGPASPANTPDAARATPSAPAPHCPGSRRPEPAWPAATHACAPADTPARNNTAGWDFAAAPKTTDHNTDNDASPPSPCTRSRTSNQVWPSRGQHGPPCQNGRHPVRYIRTGGNVSLASAGSVSISGKAHSRHAKRKDTDQLGLTALAVQSRAPSARPSLS